MDHFAFPGNIDFAADDQGAFSRIFFERLLRLFIVCETMFTIGESGTISNANDTQAQQVALNPRRRRFSTETPLERERRLEIQREQRRRRRQQETAQQREQQDNKSQTNRGTGNWNIRGFMVKVCVHYLNNVSNLCISGPLSNETPKQ